MNFNLSDPSFHNQQVYSSESDDDIVFICSQGTNLAHSAESQNSQSHKNTELNDIFSSQECNSQKDTQMLILPENPRSQDHFENQISVFPRVFSSSSQNRVEDQEISSSPQYFQSQTQFENKNESLHSSSSQNDQLDIVACSPIIKPFFENHQIILPQTIETQTVSFLQQNYVETDDEVQLSQKAPTIFFEDSDNNEVQQSQKNSCSSFGETNFKLHLQQQIPNAPFQDKDKIQFSQKPLTFILEESDDDIIQFSQQASMIPLKTEEESENIIQFSSSFQTQNADFEKQSSKDFHHQNFEESRNFNLDQFNDNDSNEDEVVEHVRDGDTRYQILMQSIEEAKMTFMKTVQGAIDQYNLYSHEPISIDLNAPPNYTMMSDFELSNELKQFGFRFTTRDSALSKLYRCWQAKPISKSQSKGTTNPQINLKPRARDPLDFIKTESRFYEQILIYQPIELASLLREMGDAGISVSVNRLKNILEQNGVAYLEN
jgi:hypothetical protein